jgi:hypothetical protein
MVLSYNPVKLQKWFAPSEIRYDFYQSPHPWGPWTCVRSFSDDFLVGGHMYGPSLCAKFQERVGSNVRIVLFHAGCPFKDQPQGLYKIWEIPVVLRTKPLPPALQIDPDNPEVQYSGKWTKPGCLSGAAGACVWISFEGSGIQYVAAKDAAYGQARTYLDDDAGQIVDLNLVNFPPMRHVVTFERQGLAQGRHRFKLVAETDRPISVEGFRVFGD